MADGFAAFLDRGNKVRLSANADVAVAFEEEDLAAKNSSSVKLHPKVVSQELRFARKDMEAAVRLVGLLSRLFL